MSRSLNGSTDQIDCGTGVTAPTPAISFGGWVYMTSLSPAYSCVYSRVNPVANTGGYQLLVKSTGHIAYYVNCANQAHNLFLDPGNGSISTGAWHHLSVTASPPAGLLTGYIDGASDGTNTQVADTLSTNYGTHHTVIGFDENNAGRNLGGRLAEFGMWNVVLTAGEILALAKGALPYTIRPGSLLHYMPLYGLTSPEPDLSGFANNGILTGTALAAGPPIMPFTPRWPRFLGWTPVLPASGLGWIINRRNKLMAPKKRA